MTGNDIPDAYLNNLLSHSLELLKRILGIAMCSMSYASHLADKQADVTNVMTFTKTFTKVSGVVGEGNTISGCIIGARLDNC
jgi:hypothetical protein